MKKTIMNWMRTLIKTNFQKHSRKQTALDIVMLLDLYYGEHFKFTLCFMSFVAVCTLTWVLPCK